MGAARRFCSRVFDAFGANRQQCVIGSLYELLLAQKPRRELEMFTGPADHLFEVADKDARFLGLDTPACVENLQDCQPRHLLDGKFVLDVGPR